MARAKKSLGQNFLVDANLQRKIADALEAGAGDTVVEIGPGTGALTRHLAERAGRLVAIELDDALAAALQREFAGADNVEIVHADALGISLTDLVDDVSAARVVGNIPYNITTPLIFRLLQEPRAAVIVLMIQREVADRILAPPGEKVYGALSVGVRTVAEVERLFNVGRAAFRPVPDVESAVIRIVPHRPARMNPAETADLRVLTRTAFSWRRKQLQKILRSAPEYQLDADGIRRVQEATGIDLEARPETLAPDTFVDLARTLRSLGLPRTQQPVGAP